MVNWIQKVAHASGLRVFRFASETHALLFQRASAWFEAVLHS